MLIWFSVTGIIGVVFLGLLVWLAVAVVRAPLAEGVEVEDRCPPWRMFTASGP